MSGTVLGAFGAGLLLAGLAGCAPPPPGAIASTPVASPSAAVATATPPALATPLDPVTPPAASLAAEGGDPVVGELGSYTSGQGGSDGPWLAGTPIHVGAGEPLSVTIDGGRRVDSWTVETTAVTAPLGDRSRRLADGTGPVRFRATDRGAVSMGVTIRFAGGGSATYYWQVTVE